MAEGHRKDGFAVQSARSIAGCAEDVRSALLNTIERLVDTGIAEWSQLADGDIELRFCSGEEFRLGKAMITRVK
jgi:hypothetical protein